MTKQCPLLFSVVLSPWLIFAASLVNTLCRVFGAAFLFVWLEFLRLLRSSLLLLSYVAVSCASLLFIYFFFLEQVGGDLCTPACMRVQLRQGICVKNKPPLSLPLSAHHSLGMCFSLYALFRSPFFLLPLMARGTPPCVVSQGSAPPPTLCGEAKQPPSPFLPCQC